MDHFIPWARYPNNAIENLVVAHERCNGRKRDFLAAPEHLGRWRERLNDDSPVLRDLTTLADPKNWERGARESPACHLSPLPRAVPLWLCDEVLVSSEPDRIMAILG